MKLFRKILAATDFSEASFGAVREALAITASTGGEIAVTHVIPDLLGSPAAAGGEFNVAPLLEIEAKVRAELGKRLEPLAGDQNITLFVDRGEPYAGIVRRAETFEADLVVIGHRGHGTLERLVLGSVAERVVRYAHGPVLVVRPGGKGVVLVATDFSDPSLPAVTAGVDEAQRRGARLVLLHVVDQSAEAYAAAAGGLLGAIGALPPPGLQEERRNALLSTLQTALEREKADGEAMVLQGSPAAVIAQTAEKLAAELVVVGTHGRTGLARIALGSVAERVVRQAHCDVLAVRLARPA